MERGNKPDAGTRKLIYWSASTDLTDLIWPESFSTTLGLAHSSLPRGLDALAEVLVPEALEQVTQAISETAGSGESSSVRARTLDEIDATHLEFHTWVYRFDDSVAAQLMGTITDVSDEEWRREELLRSKELLIDTQSLANLFYWQYDVQAGEIHWSEGIYALFELDRDTELSNELFDRYIHPADYHAFVEMRAQLPLRGMPGGYDFRMIINGRIRYLRMFAAPFRDESGEIHKLMGVTQDITELKEAQETLEDLNRDLEARVDERTRELNIAQAQLRKREKLATLGQLTATVSHELRNPLATIFTSIDLLRNYGITDNPAAESLNRIERAANRCDSIIDELLDYTRLNVRSVERVQLDDFLEEFYLSWQIADEIAAGRSWDTGQSEVMMDRDLFRRVLVNVVDNACQWMSIQEGEKRLVLSSRIEGNGCVVEVIDNGPGIAEEDLKKIYEPLFSTRTFGVGLGLTIVRQIMQQLGGRIEIRSQLGEGAQVSLWLPRCEE